MKRIIITENQLKHIVKEGWGKPKPIKYSYNDKLEFIKDDNIKDGGNFGIRRNGKDYWVSRSNTITLYVYCKNENGEWCILANLRGPKATNSAKWNVICGYLDYGYSLEDTAVKECWEENGVKINKKMLKNRGTNSSRVNGSVNTTFTAVLNGVTNDYPLTNANCEPGEVADVKWIPISEVGEYEWAHNQEKRALVFAKELNTSPISLDMENIKTSLNNMLKRKEITYDEINNILHILDKK